MRGSWLASFDASTTAIAPTGTAKTVLVAAIFTVVGAGIPLVYQVVSGHNTNRREDYRACVDAVANLTAAAHGAVLASRIAASSAGADLARTGTDIALDEAYKFDSAYARLVLVAPSLEEKQKEKLDAIREDVRRIVDPAAHDVAIEKRIQEQMDEFLSNVRLSFPVFRFLHRRGG